MENRTNQYNNENYFIDEKIRESVNIAVKASLDIEILDQFIFIRHGESGINEHPLIPEVEIAKDFLVELFQVKSLYFDNQVGKLEFIHSEDMYAGLIELNNEHIYMAANIIREFVISSKSNGRIYQNENIDNFKYNQKCEIPYNTICKLVADLSKVDEINKDIAILYLNMQAIACSFIKDEIRRKGPVNRQDFYNCIDIAAYLANITLEMLKYKNMVNLLINPFKYTRISSKMLKDSLTENNIEKFNTALWQLIGSV
jgi:hypothetical protein